MGFRATDLVLGMRPTDLVATEGEVPAVGTLPPVDVLSCNDEWLSAAMDLGEMIEMGLETGEPECAV
jgi:hypothetical protein